MILHQKHLFIHLEEFLLQIEFTCLSYEFQSDSINILGLKLNDFKYKFINIHNYVT